MLHRTALLKAAADRTRPQLTFPDFVDSIRRQPHASTAALIFTRSQELFHARPELLTRLVSRVPWEHGLHMLTAAYSVRTSPLSAYRASFAAMAQSAEEANSAVGHGATVDWRSCLVLYRTVRDEYDEEVPQALHANVIRCLVTSQRWREAIRVLRVADRRGLSSPGMAAAVCFACASTGRWVEATRLLGALPDGAKRREATSFAVVEAAWAAVPWHVKVSQYLLPHAVAAGSRDSRTPRPARQRTPARLHQKERRRLTSTFGSDASLPLAHAALREWAESREKQCWKAAVAVLHNCLPSGCGGPAIHQKQDATRAVLLAIAAAGHDATQTDVAAAGPIALATGTVGNSAVLRPERARCEQFTAHCCRVIASLEAEVASMARMPDITLAPLSARKGAEASQRAAIRRVEEQTLVLIDSTVRMLASQQAWLVDEPHGTADEVEGSRALHEAALIAAQPDDRPFPVLPQAAAAHVRLEERLLGTARRHATATAARPSFGGAGDAVAITTRRASRAVEAAIRTLRSMSCPIDESVTRIACAMHAARMPTATSFSGSSSAPSRVPLASLILQSLSVTTDLPWKTALSVFLGLVSRATVGSMNFKSAQSTAGDRTAITAREVTSAVFSCTRQGAGLAARTVLGQARAQHRVELRHAGRVEALLFCLSYQRWEEAAAIFKKAHQDLIVARRRDRAATLDHREEEDSALWAMSGVLWDVARHCGRTAQCRELLADVTGMARLRPTRV